MKKLLFVFAILIFTTAAKAQRVSMRMLLADAYQPVEVLRNHLVQLGWNYAELDTNAKSQIITLHYQYIGISKTTGKMQPIATLRIDYTTGETDTIWRVTHFADDNATFLDAQKFIRKAYLQDDTTQSRFTVKERISNKDMLTTRYFDDDLFGELSLSETSIKSKLHKIAAYMVVYETPGRATRKLLEDAKSELDNDSWHPPQNKN